ncbi:acyltransferase family protein [Desulfolucanica intricata]|uniref:acyltransferase family protein n=1 Tax=Desulfolucanica intricata TaxID=1285191 RepID=UPI00082E2AC9|nr:acyltransferase [Desulfolucanica intricata]
MIFPLMDRENTKTKHNSNSLIVPKQVLDDRGWVKEMELLRGVACIWVVVGHSATYPHTTLLLEVINQLTCITVPLFLFLSSFLAFYTNPNGTPRGYLKKQLSLVGVPYLFWVTLYTWLPVLTGKTQVPTFSEYLVKLMGGAFHLYFIPIVLQFYLVFMMNRFAWFRRLLYTPWVLAGSLVLMLGIQASFSGPFRSSFPNFYLIFPAWCFYFVLGAWMARRWETIREWLERPWRPVQLAVLFPVALFFIRILPQVAAFQPLVQVSTLCMLPFLLALFSRVPKGTFLEPVARHSFGIYLIHRLPFNQFQHLYANLAPYPFFLTSLIIQGSIGYGLTLLLNRVPGFSWTVGARVRGKNKRLSVFHDRSSFGAGSIADDRS